MALHVIVGAGPIGSATALQLAERGEQVRIVTRSGGGPEHPAVERVAADATDADRLTELATGAAALYNCASPLYYRWFTDWPPLAAALLTTAERTGAVYAVMSNLYGYDASQGPISESTPVVATHPKLRLRAEMWETIRSAHEAGRVRAVEVRASDYIQANSIFTFAIGAPLLAGKRAYTPTALDVPHSWTSINDVAKLLTVVSGEERAWGRVWHVPTNAPLTVRQLATRFTEVNGLPAPKLTVLPYPALWTYGLFDPMVRELRHTRYQFVRPFTIDSRAAETEFGLAPEPLDDALRETAALLAK